MLESLKKKLGLTTVNPELTNKEVVDMEIQGQENTTANLVTAEAFAALQSELANTKETLTALTTQLEVANVALQVAEEKLAAVAAEKAQAIADARTAKLAARKLLIVDVLGEAKADALLTATEMLDDAAFDAVRSTLAGSVQAEANTALFKEVGVDAKADASKEVEKSEEMKMLEAKYQKAAQPAK